MPQLSTRLSPDTVSWTCLCGLLAACLWLRPAKGFDVSFPRAVLPILGLAVLLAALMVGRLRQDDRLVAGATAFLQMTLFTLLGVVFTYLLAADARPLWDDDLATADRWLGLQWPAILNAAAELPAALLLLAGAAYHSLVVQMMLCIVVLACSERYDRLRVLIAAAILSGTITVLASGAMPALGNLFDPDRYGRLWPSVAWLDRSLVAGLRDGTIRQIDLSHMTGIVSFPSYHAALPVILVWGLRPIAALHLPAALWAALTIAATPLFGGHYVVDVFAGLMLAVATLMVARRLPLRGSDGDQLFSSSPRASSPAYCRDGMLRQRSGRPARGGALLPDMPRWRRTERRCSCSRCEGSLLL